MWVWNAVKVILNCTRGGIIRSHVALSTPPYISVRFSSLPFFLCFALSSSLSVSPSCLKMTHAISGNSTACASCVCRPIPVLWVGAEGQRGVNAHVLCVFIFSAHQKLKLNHNVSTPIALLRLSCLNLFGTISLLPFHWKGKPVGVGRCAGWLFLWLYLSLSFLPLKRCCCTFQSQCSARSASFSQNLTILLHKQTAFVYKSWV